MGLTERDHLDVNCSYSYADYLTWDFIERVELYEGTVRMIPQPTSRHQAIVCNLAGLMGNTVRKPSLHGYLAPFDVRLSTNGGKSDHEILTVLQPDICVIRDPGKLDDRGCIGAPDLVVEVLSSGNTSTEVKYKYDAYEKYGILEYWIVYPEYGHVNIFLLNELGKFVGQHPKINGEVLQSVVFPDLSINLSEVFVA
jgi:Uma2 family endonuclease